MKPAMNQATMLPHDMRTFLNAVSRAGFKGVELRITKVSEFIGREGVDELLAVIEGEGLDLLSLNSVVLPLLEAPSEGFFKEFRRVCDISYKLGCPFIVTIPCTVPRGVKVVGSAVIDNGVKVVKNLSRIAEEFGLKVIVEPLGLWDRALRRLEDGVEIVKRVGRDNVYTMIDTFHIYLASSSLECLRDVGDRVALIHVSDAPTDKDRSKLSNDDRLLPGYGGLDLKGMVDFAKSLGYDYYVSIESFRREYWGMDPHDFARRAFESLKPLL